MQFGGEFDRSGGFVSERRADAVGQADPAGAESIEVVYDWVLSSDEITWGANLERVEGLPSRTAIATGLGLAEHLAAESPSSRYEAITTPGCDSGGGVPFTAVYGLVAAKRSQAAPVWVEDTGRWFADASDRPGRVHGVIRVITKRYETERSRTRAAQIDPTTGAFTRAHFIEHVGRHLGVTARQASSFAVLLIGLDRGDGGPMDDAAMAVAFTRLRAQMRGHEIIARHAATKYAILLEDCSAAQTAAAAARLLDALASPDGPQFRARIGAVLAPCHGRTAQALLQFAEEALEAAWLSSDEPYVRFEPDLVRASVKPEPASDELLSALNDGRVMLALQPIVEARTRKVAFFEALVRIKRLNGTLILPDALVPDAEKNGLIPLVDRRVIDLAFRRMTGDRSLLMAINASVTSLHDACWLDHLRACCRLRPDVARRLTVEITETNAIADIEATRRVLEAIKPLGVKIAIDDFGSGHSSFRNLRQLPIDYLKIDGVFAQNLSNSKDDRFFIRTLIDLARNLGIPTVAEWVEDEETADTLTGWGIGYLQGHYFGKAEIAAEVVWTGRERAVR